MSLKSKIYFLIASSMVLLCVVSCDNQSDCCTIIDTQVNILYQNSAGENLINSTPEYGEANIKVYYKQGDDFVYMYDRNLDAPGMFRLIYDADSNLVLNLHPSYYYEGRFSTTVVEIGEWVSDTLVGEFDLREDNEICTNAWLNGVALDNRYIRVEK